MSIGEVVSVPDCDQYYYVDTGMYDVEGYGSVYVVDADRPAVIDTGIGTDVDRVLSALDAVGIEREELAVIAPTHVHLDHAGGAGFLAEECPNADVYVHEIGAPHLVDPTRLIEGTKRAVGDQWRFYVEPRPVPQDRITELTDGDVIDLGNRALQTVHAPGHAPHQVVFYDPDARAVATADSCGIYVPERDQVRQTSPPPNFDLETCLDDVDSIRALDPEHLLFAHFGARKADDDVLTGYQKTLSEWVDAVRIVSEKLDDDEAVVEHFVENQDVEEVWGETKGRAETAMNVRGVLHYLDRRSD